MRRKPVKVPTVKWLTWDPETGAIRGAEGPRGFASYREAVEASRFLVRRHAD